MAHDLSSLYVERINAEHPIAVWMLNEEVDYISQLTELDRVFENAAKWTVTNATPANEVVVPSDTPFPDSHITRISGDAPVGPTLEIKAVSVDDMPLSPFNTEMGSVAVSGYIFLDTPFAQSITYGYQYYDSVLLVTTEVLHTESFVSSDAQKWYFFSNTFALPPAIATLTKLVIKINVVSGGVAGDYDFLINGFNFAQWSEGFSNDSLGVSSTLISSVISLPNTLRTIDANPYGGSSDKAYYLCSANNLFAQNFGVPLVFGSSNVTNILPNVISAVNYPAVIFPGYGFLNERGKYNEYTAEMWLRINTDTKTSRRIFGPISSADGLYVEEGFLTLVVGKNFRSHYVGEWFRPMLIHVRSVKGNVSVLLNGEQVIEISFLESTYNPPSELDNDGKSQDWLGFYGYSDVHPISVDSFAIYSYSVPLTVAKRRFVWGQGVVDPETSNSSLDGVGIFNDYGFSDSSVNYNYPDFAAWKQGFFSNLVPSSKALELPEYSLPKFNLGTKTTEEWYEALYLQG